MKITVFQLLSPSDSIPESWRSAARQLHPNDNIPESWRSAAQNLCRSATASRIGWRSATQSCSAQLQQVWSGGAQLGAQLHASRTPASTFIFFLKTSSFTFILAYMVLQFFSLAYKLGCK
ncbi:hypothetical protein LR48_Vigan13s000400 [Vigna angularis]|uniref:Uncharacterized protein n=1 Tax=Phaseolus angularis TaxID=3914 RepID=A0A0L9T3G3_PHAAN|nr:hypothetical protein LR48_Vigan13s000400 [Vigna angularis]